MTRQKDHLVCYCMSPFVPPWRDCVKIFKTNIEAKWLIFKVKYRLYEVKNRSIKTIKTIIKILTTMGPIKHMYNRRRLSIMSDLMSGIV